MSALEQEILEKFRLLSPEARLNLIKRLEQEAAATVSLGDWIHDANTFQAEMDAKYGRDHVFGMQQVIDELREENS